MKQGKKLLILPAVAVLLGMGSACSGNSENKAQDMARKALMASVDNPEAVKIVGISKPDSVFGREYVTMEEKMALSVAMMKISRRFMEDTDFDNPDSECHGMSGKMKRQMDAMTALRSLMVTGELKPAGDEASHERKPFSGWKVKIEYVSSGKPAAYPYNGYRHRWCSDEHPGSVLPPLLNMSFPERLSLYLMLVNLFVYGISQM